MGFGGGGVGTGLRAAASYMSGGSVDTILDRTRQVQSLRQSEVGSTGKTYNQLFGTKLGDAEQKLMAERAEQIAEAGRASSGAFDRKRIARAGVRSVGLAAGIAAVDFLNPFSFGWND